MKDILTIIGAIMFTAYLYAKLHAAFGYLD